MLISLCGLICAFAVRIWQNQFISRRGSFQRWYESGGDTTKLFRPKIDDASLPDAYNAKTGLRKVCYIFGVFFNCILEIDSIRYSPILTLWMIKSQTILLCGTWKGMQVVIVVHNVHIQINFIRIVECPPIAHSPVWKHLYPKRLMNGTRWCGFESHFVHLTFFFL